MRRMERKLATGLARNTIPTVLTAPAGHKYEILTVAISPGAGAAPTIYILVTAAGLNQGIIINKTTPENGVLCERFNALLIDEGDIFNLGVVGAGTAPWTYHVTYMDVDFTDG